VGFAQPFQAFVAVAQEDVKVRTEMAVSQALEGGAEEGQGAEETRRCLSVRRRRVEPRA
jgi:hypothetical protein